MKRGIFFRGDSRKYSGVFEDGFKTEDQEKLFGTPIMRFSGNMNEAPDVHPGKVVCLTRDLMAAAMFPMNRDTRTYIYVVDLELKTVLNTQQVQFEYVQQIAPNLSGPQIKAALWPMFGQERATHEVPRESIICAVEVERKPVGDSPFTGGTFRLVKGVIFNDYYDEAHEHDPVGQEMREKTATVLTGLIEDGQWMRFPTQAQAIVAQYKPSSSSSSSSS